jgi:hypothetical protein
MMMRKDEMFQGEEEIKKSGDEPEQTSDYGGVDSHEVVILMRNIIMACLNRPQYVLLASRTLYGAQHAPGKEECEKIMMERGKRRYGMDFQVI